ncbi:MAG TPA: hypothetical protein PKW95_02345 [bacterium]|nr:hypothetical protein [bacterium]
MRHVATIFLIVLLAMAALACQSNRMSDSVEIAHFPLDNTQGMITPEVVRFVSADSSDGNGALLIEAKLPMTVELFEVQPEPTIKGKTILIYQAKMKSNDLKGNAYLEMWCDFGPKGEYVTRGQKDAVSGNSDWETVQTHYTVPQGKILGRVKLNLVINGQGNVWLDDLRLLKSEQ